MKTFGKAFWAGAVERAVKTAAQGLVLVLGGDAANVLHLDAKTVLGGIVGGFLLSLATSVASAPVGPADSPSLVQQTPGT